MKSRKLFITLLSIALVILALTACDTLDKGYYTLNIVVEGEGGKVTRPGEGLFIYEYGNEVEILVEVDEGYEVTWAGPDGDKVVKAGDNYKIKIVGDMEIHAVFGEKKATEEDYIVYYDFEDGDKGSWVQFGSLDITIEAKGHESERSLYASNRSEDFAGPAIDLKDKLENGKKYSFEIWVYQETGSTQTIKMSRKRSDANGDDYGQIAQSDEVESGVWTKLENEAYLVEYEREIKELSVYIEAEKSVNFYIDDFLVKEVE
ncbi:MAG: carbohydrate binding domain-containing protein [Bacillota bacterium]|jgi:hypothetical protein|nr:carbohydrate binding domain-containing protein [Bacillota bacterium]